MSKKKFKPSDYQIKDAILEATRYQGIYVGDNYVMKDHGDYIEVNVDAGNKKGHVSYNVYYDDDGRITSVVPHRSN